VIFNITFTTIGVLLFILSRKIANAANQLSVRMYEVFPRLKSLPRSHFAGTQQNFKTTFYSLRIIGALMTLAGVVFFYLSLFHPANQTPRREPHPPPPKVRV
jgi:hypothetical protein